MLNRSINYITYDGTHKCSSYCLVITIIKVLYNTIKHKHVKDVGIVTETSIRYAKLIIAKCRMDYGKENIFDSFGENALTRGILIPLFIKIIRKSNGQRRYDCTRNHPRILAEPHYFLYYEGNNDT